jgi:hypothetical protein
MSKQTENYRPANIEFDVANSSIVPDNLGFYENETELYDFVHKNMISFSQKLTVNRFMDNFEKQELRKDYQELLELKYPLVSKELDEANANFEKAKKIQKDCVEMVNATLSEVKALANEVKNGLRNITLDDLYTFRVPYKSKYYYFTWIDKALKLCKIAEIPDYEKTEIFNALGKNEEFFEINFGQKSE